MNDELLSHVAAQTLAQQVAVAYLLARDMQRTDKPLHTLHELLSDEMARRSGASASPVAPASQARSVHALDMLVSLADQMGKLMRPAGPTDATQGGGP